MTDARAVSATEAPYTRSRSEWFAAIVGLCLVLLGLRAFFDPVSASAAFGVPMHNATETTFVQVYGARNAFLGAVALTWIALRMLKPVALLFTLATVLPPLDAWVIATRDAASGALIRHAIIFVVLVSVSVLLWRRERAGRQWSS
jgi:hypothetical protein